MKKKLLITLVIIGLVIVSVIAVLFFVNRDTTFSATTLAEIKKTLNDDSLACLKSSDSITIDEADQTGLENAVVSSIIDVPAGTNVDIQVATFDTTEATGTAKYAGDYGSYNYVVKKVSDIASGTQSQSIWEVTSFVACKS